MIVPQAEIDLVLNPKMRRRMMRLPAPNRKCPLKYGSLYRLQPSAGAKGQATIVVIEPPHRERLAAITLSDARREGYASVQGALEAWERTHWCSREDELVWVVAFARDEKGECAEFVNQDESVYLSKVRDYTIHAGRQAVRGDPPLLAPLAEDLARARLAATERVSPHMESIARMRAESQTLREAMVAMKDRNALRMLGEIERKYDQLAARFSVDPSATLPESHVLSAEGSASVDRPNSTESLVHLEPAA